MIKRHPGTRIVRMTKRRFDRLIAKAEHEMAKKIFDELTLCLIGAVDVTDICDAILKLEEKYGVNE